MPATPTSTWRRWARTRRAAADWFKQGMDKLIDALTRLYLAPEAVTREALAQHLQGKTTLAIQLTTADKLTRALAIPFRKLAFAAEGRHWTRLCEVANAIQGELGLPAPAVSIDGASAYYLWLSLETPVPTARAQDFLAALRQAYFPEIELAPDAATAPVYLPPCLNPRSGKWVAFIHPGMGASFADESGLEMAPPVAGQVAFLEGLDSIGAAQFEAALDKLQRGKGALPAVPVAPAVTQAPAAAAAAAAVLETTVPAHHAPAGGVSAAQPLAAPEGLLLKDATLEDIVRYLHSKNIEPTFRHLLPK
jgi:hypothetical protein